MIEDCLRKTRYNSGSLDSNTDGNLVGSIYTNNNLGSMLCFSSDDSILQLKEVDISRCRPVGVLVSGL